MTMVEMPFSSSMRAARLTVVADGAVGNQNRRIDSVGFAAGDDLRTIDLEGYTMAAIGRGTMKR
jgi:hypothetical protein